MPTREMLKVDTQPYRQHRDSLHLKSVIKLEDERWTFEYTCRNFAPWLQKTVFGSTQQYKSVWSKVFPGERMPPKLLVKQTGQMYAPLSSIPVTQNLRLPKPRFFSNCRLSLFICEIFLSHVRNCENVHWDIPRQTVFWLDALLSKSWFTSAVRAFDLA